MWGTNWQFVAFLCVLLAVLGYSITGVVFIVKLSPDSNIVHVMMMMEDLFEQPSLAICLS